MTSADDGDLIDATENWFVHNGIPHFIDDFTASEDVWTRAVGFLTFVFFSEMFLTFGRDVSGWQQLGAFIGGLALVGAGIVAVNRLRGRSNFARPEEIGIGELALFVTIPPVLALIGGHRTTIEFFGVVLLNILVLIGIYLVVSWGLFSMVRWGLVAMWVHLTRVVQLLGRVLPLMLLFSAFLFLNAEIWQVVNDLPLVLFSIVVGALVFIGLSFLIGSMQGAIHGLRFFDDWAEVGRELDGTPLEGCDTSVFPGSPEHVPLGRAARTNLTLRLVVGLSAQVLLVTGLIFGFYVLFGVLTVREDTVLQWTTLSSSADVTLGSFSLNGERMIVTSLHLVTAGFVAAFSGLQFAVSLVTDDTYREEFVAESNAEVRQAIAVRAAYLNLVKSST
ncbi:MAG: hypothetical protein ACI81L_001510 [Verrucomicrobiales bacterium]